MQDIEYVSCAYQKILFSCSKRCQTKFYTLFNNKDPQQKRAKTIAINHSEDIDYKDFRSIHRICTKELYSFLIIDIILPADNSLCFRKKSFTFIIKMTLTDELKVLDDKIKGNLAQYDLDAEASRISALSV